MTKNHNSRLFIIHCLFFSFQCWIVSRKRLFLRDATVFARRDKTTMAMWRCHPGRRRRRTRSAQRWSYWCRHKTNSLTTSLSPKWDEWTSWDFIWIRNEAVQRKPIGHHFPHSGQAMNRPKEHHLLRLILYCIPPVTLKPSIALLPGMNQDMGSPTLPRVGVSGRKMNCTIRPLQHSNGIVKALISPNWFCSAGWGRSDFTGEGYNVQTFVHSTVCFPLIEFAFELKDWGTRFR